jgi:TetR/AcrR family transcriptional regulator, cholesterol catabolism regulator
MKTRKATQKRDKILAAAAKVFKEKGYAEATLNDVASEAGTFAGSLYYYFDSKEALVAEVLGLGTSRVADLVSAKVAALPKNTGKLERLSIALRSHLALALERDDFALAYWRIIDQVPAAIRETNASGPRAYGRFWKKLVQEAQDAGEVRADLDPRIVSLMFLGSTLYALDWYHEEGSYSVDDLADVLLAMTLDGISADRAKAKLAKPEPVKPVDAVSKRRRAKRAS